MRKGGNTRYGMLSQPFDGDSPHCCVPARLTHPHRTTKQARLGQDRQRGRRELHCRPGKDWSEEAAVWGHTRQGPNRNPGTSICHRRPMIMTFDGAFVRTEFGGISDAAQQDRRPDVPYAVVLKGILLSGPGLSRPLGRREGWRCRVAAAPRRN
jgi:hypothetical protein